ncbi:MAG: CsgG/HfaB family protein [Spirochaetia bacterium]|nr:CsgG/HfaB family protein [Spirochaetia bacterium]
MNNLALNMSKAVLLYFIWIVLLAAATVTTFAVDATGSTADEKLVNRKVLILDFVNSKNSPDYMYLENSIPDAFLDPLDRTKSFELLSRSIWQKMLNENKFKKEDAYREEAAIDAGKFAGADVVIIGSFAALTDKMQIFAKAIELSSGRVMVSRNASAPLDNNMFDTINKLTVEMSAQMKEKLPPLPQKIITIEREKYITITKEEQKSSLEEPTYGGMIWRTAVAPGWGHIYANQWRGWVYMPLWVASAGTFVFGIIDTGAKEAAYKSATSGLESKYASYNNARKLRNFSLLAVLGVYAVSIGDILITGNHYAAGKSMLKSQTLNFSLEPDLEGFRATIGKKW